MGGGGKTLNEPLHRPLHKRSTKNSQILAVYKAATNNVSLHLGRLTAKLVDRLTAQLMNRLTPKLVDRLTAKLVVVNLVKLHLTKFNQLPRLSGRWVPGASTMASQPLDRKLPPWLAHPSNPAISPHSKPKGLSELT